MQKEFEKQEKLKNLDDEHKQQMLKDIEDKETKHKEHEPVSAVYVVLNIRKKFTPSTTNVVFAVYIIQWFILVLPLLAVDQIVCMVVQVAQQLHFFILTKLRPSSNMDTSCVDLNDLESFIPMCWSLIQNYSISTNPIVQVGLKSLSCDLSLCV